MREDRADCDLPGELFEPNAAQGKTEFRISATGLAKQILTKAKVEELTRHGQWQLVDLEVVAREVVLQFGPLQSRKRMDFSLESCP